jgi:hypothetical protein
MASKNKDMMARTAEEYAEDIATTAEIVRGWAKQMFEDAVNRRYRKVRDTAQKIGQTMTRFDAELAKPIIASRSGAKEMMAREVVARKGSKRVELSGPQADGRWVVTVMQEEKQVVPGEANDRFVESKFYSTEAGARRAASKMLVSRPGAKATFKVEDRFYFGKGRKERFDRYGYEKMDYDRLVRESWHLKDSAEYAVSLGRKDNELRQKMSALQKEFTRRGFTAAATVLDAALRKPFSRPGQPERFADDRLAKFLDVYNRNEDNNYHSKNVVLLAKFLGSTDDVAQAQRIANEQRRSSDGISEKLYKERTELNRRLLSKFRSRYPQADI